MRLFKKPASSTTRSPIRATATVASITMFRERDQAERSNELAAEWVAESLADFEVERMGVMGGEVMVSRAIADLLEPAHH